MTPERRFFEKDHEQAERLRRERDDAEHRVAQRVRQALRDARQSDPSTYNVWSRVYAAVDAALGPEEQSVCSRCGRPDRRGGHPECAEAARAECRLVCHWTDAVGHTCSFDKDHTGGHSYERRP